MIDNSMLNRFRDFFNEKNQVGSLKSCALGTVFACGSDLKQSLGERTRASSSVVSSESQKRPSPKVSGEGEEKKPMPKITGRNPETDCSELHDDLPSAAEDCARTRGNYEI